MTNPTHQEIIDAHEALEELYYAACALNLHGSHDSEEEWHSAILKVLPPKPRPTMAEVEWDDEVHYLAEAEHPEYGKVIMFGKNFFFGHIRIMRTKEKGALWIFAEPGTLTPTGKRYTLTEVQE